MPSYETQSNGWGQEQAQQIAGSRLREALQNPALQERAKSVITGIGTEAAIGAGVVKVDKNGELKANKLGIAKALFSPNLAAAKAAKAATSEVRSIATNSVAEAQNRAKQEATSFARRTVGDIYGQIEAAPAWGQTAAETAPQTPTWEQPATPSYHQPEATSGWGSTPDVAAAQSPNAWGEQQQQMQQQAPAPQSNQGW